MMFVCLGGLVAFSLLFLDLITKAWAYAVEIEGGKYFLGFIRFQYLPGGNTGIAWGMFGDAKAGMVIITVLTALMIVGLVALFFTVFKKNRPAQICLSVIVAGAMGNFLDRIMLGYVRDFVDVSPIGFGICNFADFYITFGAVALFIVILFVGKEAMFPLGKYKKQREEEKRQKEEKHEEN